MAILKTVILERVKVQLMRSFEFKELGENDYLKAGICIRHSRTREK